MKFFFLLFSLYIFKPAFGDIIINDPSDLLGTIDNYINNSNFDSAYSLGDKAWFNNQECIFTMDENGQYSAECKPSAFYEVEVLEKTPLNVLINNFSLSKQQFDDVRGNFLRLYLMTSFNNVNGQISTVQMEKIGFETAIFQNKIIQAIRASYTINFCKIYNTEEFCFIIPQEILLGRNIPAVAQILEHIYIRTTPIKIPVSKMIDYQRI